MMDKTLFTIDDIDQAIKSDKKIKKVYIKVKEFEEWFSLQGKGLKDMINDKLK